MSDFILARLEPAESHLAYPLIRESAPGVTLPAWNRFVRRTASVRFSAREGVIAARRSGRDFPSGLFCYRRENDMQHGTVLTADHVVAVDILDPRPLLDALLREMDALAKRHGCVAVRAFVHQGSTDVTGSFIDAGHRVDGATMFKRLIAAPASRVRSSTS